MRNQYISLELKLLYLMLKRKKVTLKKIGNAIYCFYAYLFKFEKTGRMPMMVSLEIGNDCNANCLFCRDENGVVHNLNPNGPKEGIAKGRMPFEMCIEIIKQLKDHVLIAVLYTNGEPLLYKHIIDALRFARDNRVATMIATNGLLLNETKISQLLDAGVDFIKIAISGYTQKTYNVQVRNGDVETVKNNIRLLASMNKNGKYGTIIMVDYILYNYNKHELRLVQKFCADLNIMLNLRQGNPAGGLEGKEPALFDTSKLPLKISCGLVWKAIQVNWNGDILPCCDALVWSGAEPLDRFEINKTRLAELWNGKKYMALRRVLTKEGRQAIPICSTCVRRGIAFKW